jgi:uncharacterized protein with NRDE domain
MSKDGQNLIAVAEAVASAKIEGYEIDAETEALCTKLAEVLNSSKDEIYEEELQKYGYLDEETVITVKSEVDMSRIDGHWRLIKDNGKFKAYIRVRGSSEYNSKEMAHFLDMIILDAKEQGIETDTPEQIEEYKRLYEQRYGKLCERKENV